MSLKQFAIDKQIIIEDRLTNLDNVQTQKTKI